jgi:hypothetical protein
VDGNQVDGSGADIRQIKSYIMGPPQSRCVLQLCPRGGGSMHKVRAEALGEQRPGRRRGVPQRVC